MKLSIRRQETYSRGELLLRTFFGCLYIGIPHGVSLIFVSLVSSLFTLIAFFSILFTGNYPESMFNFQKGMYAWLLRYYARIYNLADGYPAFGFNAEDENTSLEVERQESYSRGLALLRLLFGIFYVGLPHGLCLIFRGIGVMFVMFVAWWAVLFTGKYPESMHNFVTGYFRWSFRVNMYIGYMTDEYPPFSGRE